MNIRLNKTQNTLSIGTTGNAQDGTYGLNVGRLDNDNAQYFDHAEIALRPNDTATLDGNWLGDQEPMPLLIDRTAMAQWTKQSN